MMATKQAIASRFGQAAASYDQFSTLQRSTGQRLWSLIGSSAMLSTRLDLGCGSGYFLPQLAQDCQRLIGVDLSPAMLKMSAQRNTPAMLIQGDAESLPLADSCCDLIFSNLALQWCDHLGQALAECWRVLAPGGMLLWSSLAQGTLAELQQSFQVVDGEAHIRTFLSLEAIEQQAWQQHSWQQADLSCEPMVLYYAQLRDLLRELKGFGANHLDHRRPGLMTPSQLRSAERYYEQNFVTDSLQLPATYQVIYGVFRK
ncbi:malonyl-ACP O-methyltransferase BioC [Celerinatantimonas sp. YJH-8]|uniref:malonyl-ACP O-methyltransferase BioC n=1 Tax=Celerinatantimonas sp. YJH-8 TaxID=3228714 RepID=UPI0038C571DF